MNYFENNLDISKAIQEKEKCLSLIKANFTTDNSTRTPYKGFWVLEDGTLICCNTHSDIDRFLIEKGYIKLLDKKFSRQASSQFMEQFNVVRLRNETPSLNIGTYLILPPKPLSSIQFRLVEEWITDILTNSNFDLIIDVKTSAKRYKKYEDLKAIEDIKFYYRVGILE